MVAEEFLAKRGARGECLGGALPCSTCHKLWGREGDLEKMKRDSVAAASVTRSLRSRGGESGGHNLPLSQAHRRLVWLLENVKPIHGVSQSK